MSIAALLDTIVETINREAISKLCAFNGFDRSTWPELTHGDIESADLAQLGTFITQATSAGALIPDEGLETHLREMAGLPVKDVNALSVASIPAGGFSDFSESPIDVDIVDEPKTELEESGEALQVDASTALNGAQVTAALGIVELVASGQMPRDAAITQIQTFFNLTEDQAVGILGSVGK